jgi:iron complex outermembrane recepter protein
LFYVNKKFVLHLPGSVFSIAFCIMCMAIPSFAQENPCHITFHGHVSDASTNESLPGVIVEIKEKAMITVTDSNGIFQFSNICPGKYTFVCHFLGYKTLTSSIQVDKFSHPSFEMVGDISNIVVTGERKNETLHTLDKIKLQGVDIDKTRGESLGDALKGITGVNTMVTGPGVSKPVIHGLHSNRILILNNGVRLEGQQWGSDHGPELDPYIASEISVIKGPASIRYGSDAIGGVIMLQPKTLPGTPGIGGEINLAGATNNALGAGSAMLEGAFGEKLTGLSWRMQGTFKKAGNSKAPDYYLDNTGFQEEDYSGTISYKKDLYGAEAYYSHYSTKTGILTASEIGTLQDLETAINSPVPNERSVFSYDINRPYQFVNHDLVKASGHYNLQSAGKLELVYALQQDVRQEYGLDAAVTSNTPDDYFKIVSHTIDLNWNHPAIHGIYGNIGIQAETQGNTYQGTDAFSVIPDFRNYSSGIYAIEKWTRKKVSIEGGLRYDFKWIQVYLPNLMSPQHKYSNLTSSLGANYSFTDHLSLNFNYGSAWRAPSPSELYGRGIHASAASFETGDSSLSVERAYNFSASLKYQVKKFIGEIGLYNNIINNFIFLKPDKPVKVDNNTYPGFLYTQANVVFRGIDLDLKYFVLPSLDIFSKSTIVRAFNYSINDYLVFTPADRFENGIQYNFKPFKKLKKCYIGVSNLYVAHQGQAPANSDYAPPPPSYILFNAEAGGFVYIKNQEIEINVSVNNIGNVAYRDYLDRLRYFADESGRNFILRLKIPFTFKKQNDQPDPNR